MYVCTYSIEAELQAQLDTYMHTCISIDVQGKSYKPSRHIHMYTYTYTHLVVEKGEISSEYKKNYRGQGFGFGAE